MRENKGPSENNAHQMELILNSAGEGIFGLDTQGTIIFANSTASQLLGYGPSELIGQDAFKVLKQTNSEGTQYSSQEFPIYLTLKNGLSQTCSEDRFHKKDGSFFYVEYISNPMRDNGQIIGAVTTFNDITERLRIQETIRNLAFHDSLTGLPNRILFIDRLNVALAHAQRYKEKLAVLFVDLDDFKPVNDKLGHAVGDLLLREFAKRLTCSLREGDTVARYGGDEFVVILTQIGEKENASVTAQKIRTSIQDSFECSGNSIKVSASIGLALFPEHGVDGDTLLKSADKALYQAKDKGKNQICLYPNKDIN